MLKSIYTIFLSLVLVKTSFTINAYYEKCLDAIENLFINTQSGQNLCNILIRNKLGLDSYDENEELSKTYKFWLENEDTNKNLKILLEFSYVVFNHDKSLSTFNNPIQLKTLLLIIKDAKDGTYYQLENSVLEKIEGLELKNKGLILKPSPRKLKKNSKKLKTKKSKKFITTNSFSFRKEEIDFIGGLPKSQSVGSIKRLNSNTKNHLTNLAMNLDTSLERIVLKGIEKELFFTIRKLLGNIIICNRSQDRKELKNILYDVFFTNDVSLTNIDNDLIAILSELNNIINDDGL